MSLLRSVCEKLIYPNNINAIKFKHVWLFNLKDVKESEKNNFHELLLSNLVLRRFNNLLKKLHTLFIRKPFTR